MVIDRLGTDLQKKFEECGKRFPRKLVLQLGLRLVSYFYNTCYYIYCTCMLLFIKLNLGD